MDKSIVSDMKQEYFIMYTTKIAKRFLYVLKNLTKIYIQR